MVRLPLAGLHFPFLHISGHGLAWWKREPLPEPKDGVVPLSHGYLRGILLQNALRQQRRHITNRVVETVATTNRETDVCYGKPRAAGE